MTDNSKSQMGMNRSKKALLGVIPPLTCVTFRRASFWSQPENSWMQFWDDRAENTTNAGSGSHDNFSEKVDNHEHRSTLDPCLFLRAENEAFESPRCYEANGTRAYPPNYHMKFRIRQKSNGPHRPNCPTGSSVSPKSVAETEAISSFTA